MEINTQQMEALLQIREQQAQLQHRNNGQAQGFDALLAQQINNDYETAAAQHTEAPQATLYSQFPTGETEAASPLSADMAVLDAAFAEASGALDMWDSYSRMLGGSSTSLKEAYSMLEGIDAKLSQLRSNPAVGISAGLDSILNELEVLSATEKFKFNRGDYLV